VAAPISQSDRDIVLLGSASAVRHLYSGGFGAQAAVDAWRQDYNADRPHQSLGMAFPSARFARATGEALGLRVPAELDRLTPARSAGEPASADVRPPPVAPASADRQLSAWQAVELERVVPPSGNLWLAGQQIWLGPAMTGRTIRLHAGLDRVHVLLDGYRIKDPSLPAGCQRLCPASQRLGPRQRGRRRCHHPRAPLSSWSGP